MPIRELFPRSQDCGPAQSDRSTSRLPCGPWVVPNMRADQSDARSVHLLICWGLSPVCTLANQVLGLRSTVASLRECRRVQLHPVHFNCTHSEAPSTLVVVVVDRSSLSLHWARASWRVGVSHDGHMIDQISHSLVQSSLAKSSSGKAGQII